MPRTGDIIAIDAERFVLEDGLGVPGEGAKGGFGVVHAARRLDAEGRPAGPPLAIKLIDRGKVREYGLNAGLSAAAARQRFIASLNTEITTLKALQRHHGRLEAVRIVDLVHSGLMTFEDEPDHPYPALVMARCGPSLAHIATAGEADPAFLLRRRLLTRQGILDLLADMARALAAIDAIAPEGRRMVHRDVKPQNILERNGRFSLIDFGSTKAFFDHGTGSVGGITLSYAAPELWPVLTGRPGSGEDTFRVVPTKVDVYALGMTLAFVLTRTIPWRQKSLDRPHDGEILDTAFRRLLRRAIDALPADPATTTGETTVLPGPAAAPAAPPGFGDGLEDLLAAMVRVSRSDRPDVQEIGRRVKALRSLPPASPAAAAGCLPAPSQPQPQPQPRSRPRSRPRSVLAMALGGLAVAVTGLATAAPARPVLSLGVVPPLGAAGLARWSGVADAPARPLCGPSRHGGAALPAGEWIVATVDVSAPGWLSGRPEITGTIRPAEGTDRPLACVPLGRARDRWQCAGETRGLPAGEAALHVRAAGTHGDLIRVVRIAAGQADCPAS